MTNTENTHSHFGIYGIIKRGNEILLIKKSRAPYQGKYDLPGGSPNADERNEDTLVREITEETGLIAKVYKLLCAQVITIFYEYSADDKSFILKHSALFYSIESFTGDCKQTPDGKDSGGAEWIDISKISDNNASPLVLKALQFL